MLRPTPQEIVYKGTISDLRISAVDGTAFIDNCAAITAYADNAHRVEIYDSAGKRLVGIAKEAGSGETLGGELIDGWTNPASQGYDTTFTVSGTDITSAVNVEGYATCYDTIASPEGKLLKWGSVITTNNDLSSVRMGPNTTTGGTPFADFGTPVSSGTYSLYRTGVTGAIYFRMIALGAIEFSAINNTLKQVLTPSTDGIIIVNEKGGATENFLTKDAGFSYNAASYTVIVKKIKGLTVHDLYDIGEPATAGFGVGVCIPDMLPTGFTPLSGCYDLIDDNYGNYQFTEGSIFVYVPWFVYRINNAGNPTNATYTPNDIDVKGTKTYSWSEVNISGITAADPAVVTTTVPHGRTEGDYIWISHITSDANWSPYSGQLYKVGTVGSSTTFNLQTAAGVNVDSSGYGGAFSNATDADAKMVYTGAEAAGYAVHRAFIDGGKLQKGFFYAKYKGSKIANGSGYSMGSVKNGMPISTHAAHNPIADLTACTVNQYYETIKAAHAIDGVDGAENSTSIFFAKSRFQDAAVFILSLAHGQAATSTTNCAWYHATYNYPKGLNNNQAPVENLISNADCDDNALTYLSDGYSNCGLTGSGDPFAKTTHNGQNCGIADINGLMNEVAIGLTCIASTSAIEAMTQASPCQITITGHGYADGDWMNISTPITQADWTGLNSKVWQITKVDDNNFTVSFDASGIGVAYDAGTDPGTATLGKFYLAKPSTAMKDFDSGVAGATDHWGATGVAAMMDAFTPPFKDGSAYISRLGSGANQVLSESLYGDSWLLTGLGIPKDSDGHDTTGTNLFGKDYFYQYVRNDLCLLSFGLWNNTSNAGGGNSYWHNYRTVSHYYVGGRAACYVE